MSPLMIASIADSELVENRERAARLRLRRQVRAQSRREDGRVSPVASASQSIRSKLHVWAHPV